jgi:glutathione reductase (NADPH)
MEHSSDASAQIARALSTSAVVGMAPITQPKHDQYDIVFIGGGSGGVAGSVRLTLLLGMLLLNKRLLQRRAASYGKKVALIEATTKLGGTCVNVGE